MSNEETKLHQEIATRNSREAIRKSDATRDELLVRISHLEQIVSGLSFSVQHLEQKYNLLLSARFDGKSTTG
jgi:hypothetical protein